MRFHSRSENASNVFRPHYAGRIITSFFKIIFIKMLYITKQLKYNTQTKLQTILTILQTLTKKVTTEQINANTNVTLQT